MKKLPIVEVEWVDSSGRGGWHSREDHRAQTPSHILSVGYLVKSTKRHVTILQSADTEVDLAEGSTTIPRSAIRSIRKLG